MLDGLRGCEMANDNEKLNWEIRKLWNKYCKSKKALSPLFFSEFKKGCLLFIGLNPSISEKDSNDFYKWHIKKVWNG